MRLLSPASLGNEDLRPVFYDIETTGLSRNSSFLYLIGAVVRDEGIWQLYQWMAERPEEEISVLKAFSEFLSRHRCTVSYNGDHFDRPYLEARGALYGLPSPFDGKESLDLYLRLKPLKKLLKLTQMKQPDLEEFLGISNRVYCNGRECIRLYKDFLKKRDAMTAETVLGHNLEDVLGLGKIFSMLGYLELYEGNYEVEECVPDDEFMMLTLKLPCALPTEFSNGTEAFYITGRENTVKLIIKSSHGRFRQYHPNYKDYDYLPGEDTAIPKSLSAFVDRRLKKSATKDTCYTWFACTEEFLANPSLQKQYLSRTLPCLLGTLK